MVRLGINLNQSQVDEFITVDKNLPLTSWLVDILTVDELTVAELTLDDLTWYRF